mgnify:FL=1
MRRPPPTPARLLCLAILPGWLLGSVAQHTAATDLRIDLRGGVPHLQTAELPGQILVLQHSPDLRHWTETARAFQRLHPYSDGSQAAATHGFYRVQAAPISPDHDWAHQLEAATPRLFQPAGAAGAAMVKWCLLLDQPDRVYFQDTVRYPFHLQFARARLPGYAGISAMEFYRQSLYATASQRMAVGAVLRHADPRFRELAMDLTGAEAFPAERAVEWILAVQRRLVAVDGWRVFYMPSPEQRAETEAHLDLFTQRGIEVGTLSRPGVSP